MEKRKKQTESEKVLKTIRTEQASSSSNSFIANNINKTKDFASWMIWYPDLYCDLIKPERGGINLHFDQRVFMRCITRFFSTYGCFPRGWGKTHGELLCYFIVAIRYPNITLSISAQTKSAAAGLISDKYNEIIRQFSLIENEIRKHRFTKDEAYIEFKNGAVIDNLVNDQQSKGKRRIRINIEESALLNNILYEDALAPVVEVPRLTCGKMAIANPEELNNQINFFTTPGWRGSEEHERNIEMLHDMRDLKGKIVIGADWMLGSWFGRGSSKSSILQKKRSMSPTYFDQNYGGKWTGSADGGLVSIDKLQACRVLETPLLQDNSGSSEFYIAVDVARSSNINNNKSSVVVGKVIRNKRTNRVQKIQAVNLFSISNTLNFTLQAVAIKKLRKQYNAKMVIVDANGLGIGLVDELMKDTIDPSTGDSLGCWDTINTDDTPEIEYSEQCLYALKSQSSSSSQNKIVTTFIDMVNSKKLELLRKRSDLNILSEDSNDEYERSVLPFLQTDLLIEEIANLKTKQLNNGALAIERVVRRMDKDRFSCLSYLLFYINEFEDMPQIQKTYDYSQIPSMVSALDF